MPEKLSIPTLTFVLYVIELFSLIYYLILLKNTRSRSALVFSLATIYMISVNIIGFTYSATGWTDVWKVYICLLSFLWPYFAYGIDVFHNPEASSRNYTVAASAFLAISLAGVMVFDRDIIALQSSAISMAIGLGYGAVMFSRLDKKINSAGRLVGIALFSVYASVGLARGLISSFDLAWESHFYIGQTGVQTLYFLVSVVFASLLPITVYVIHNEKISYELKKNAAVLAEEKQKLQLSLDEIKTLRGIIPICMNCKKIRNDEGYWEDVAVYIHEHSYADMSHGICPDCVKVLYPEIYEKMVKKGDVS